MRIDARTEAVTSIPLDGPPVALAVGAGGVWVASASRAEVLRIDPRANRVVARIPTGATPTALAVSEDAVWVGVT